MAHPLSLSPINDVMSAPSSVSPYRETIDIYIDHKTHKPLMRYIYDTESSTSLLCHLIIMHHEYRKFQKSKHR